jgi:hypothetical protein
MEVQKLKKWEYRVVDLIKETGMECNGTQDASGRWVHASDLEQVLNKLGAEGWELVNVHFIINHGETVVVGFFKRLLQH